MNPGARPHEREAVDDLDTELRTLGSMLRSTPLPEPPPACDAAIRAAAREAASRKRHGGGRWSGILAAAATVSLAIGIGWHASRDAQVTPVPADERDVATPAARSPESGAIANAPATADRTAVAAETGMARTSAAPLAAPVAMAPVPEAATAAADSAEAAAPAPARAAAAGTRPDPVAWLARIDTLRRAGRHDEAAREEAALDAAWPGWRQVASPTR